MSMTLTLESNENGLWNTGTKSIINIACSSMQYDWTKHAEVDQHVVETKLENGLFCTSYIPIKGQPADILRKFS